VGLVNTDHVETKLDWPRRALNVRQRDGREAVLTSG
jgi:hypothetical protein